MSKDAQDEFLGGGGLVLKFAEIGDNYTMQVTEEPDVVPIRDYDDDSIILTWPDGREKKQMIIYGQLTEESEGWSDDEEDTGERRLYVKGYMAGALKDALRKAKARKVTPGGELYVEFSEEGEPKNRKFQPPKLFEMEWTPGSPPKTKASRDDADEFENDEVDEAQAVAPRRGRAAAKVAEPKPRSRGRAAKQEEPEDEPAAKPARGRGRSATPVTDGASSARTAARKRAAAAAAAADDPDDEPPF